MNNICIIGAGVTGLSMLLLLQESGADLSKVVIIDPHFDGGDLARKWTAVQSNTPWSKTTRALSAACPSLTLPEINGTTKLADIAHLLRNLATPAMKNQIQGTVTKANYNPGTQTWSVQILAGGKPVEIQARKLILAPGSDPKTLDLPIPSIPLEVAIDASRLQHYITLGQSVLVFGTMHSGTLVIRNLVTSGAKVTAYYNSEKPFYWARDGAYDGIKEEAATIADDIIAGQIPVELVPVKDTSKVIRTSRTADWVVYAMGFSARETLLSQDEVVVSSKAYDGATGALKDVPNAWGFGTAYPNCAPDGIHWDVSVAAFIEHMKTQMPAILSGL